MSMAYEGIRIIDFTLLEQGPVGTQVLADFGAEVIKIERIDVGDILRGNRPIVNGVSTFFAACNRNKKSLSVNVKTPEGKEIIYKLVKMSDVVASNFRPGVMERLGFGWEELSKINPRIICAYASGYGQTGPYRDRRGQDLIAQAMGGLMAITGERNGPPTAAGTFVADFVGGMLLAQGIMAALAARERTGKGQVVDSCLLNTVVTLPIGEATSYLNAGQTYPRPYHGGCHSAFGPLYATYQTKDGKWLVIVGTYVDKELKRVFTALGVESDLPDDPRFQASADGWPDIGVGREAELRPMLEKAFSRMTREEALHRLEEQDILAAPVYEHSEVFSDPQILHNEMIQVIEHPVAGSLKLVGVPVKLSETPATLRLPPPTVGQHNEEILALLDYTGEQLRQLQQGGIIGSENLKG